MAATLVKKKVDSRIATLIDNGIKLRHRSMFVVVGDRGRDQVVILHQILTKASVRTRPSVLWCYKKDLGFTTHQQKRAKKVKRDIARGLRQADETNPFDTFVGGTDIRYAYYKDSHKVLGNTYGMLILQDFAALTPNLLARTIETVEGGGLVVLLLKTMDSLKQLYSMAMDVHTKFRTEAHSDVVPRFNERFLLSLADCSTCLLVDDELNILPISSHVRNIKKISLDKEVDEKGDSYMTDSDIELAKLKISMKDTQPVGALVEATRTFDQGKAVMKFVEAIAEKTLRSTVVLTAARGRGKSAALGLSIAGAVAYGYSNIFVTAPSPENLKTLFEMVFLGFDKLEYKEHQDYEVIQSTNPLFNKAIVRVNIFHTHRQTIQYIQPSDHARLSQAELLVIDEAAAIPLPMVEKLLGPYLVFMSSTINGYEGTGRSLSMKLVKNLRHQSKGDALSSSSDKSTKQLGGGGRVLTEITLEDPIRYGRGDHIERWLNDLLCLDCSNHIPKLIYTIPHPSLCDLYYVNRDTLFSHHKASEAFLQRMMSLYVSSHYKNSPNDLQLMSDAPAHHLFVLLGPQTDTTGLPDILCVIQVCLEGELSKESVLKSMSRGQKTAGDLIPWCISQQFQNNEFASLSGARVVRIATHPELQRMGYASRALELLGAYYEGKLTNLTEAGASDAKATDSKKDKKKSKKDGKDGAAAAAAASASSDSKEAKEAKASKLLSEELAPRSDLAPVMVPLSKRPPEFLHYVGVSYGLTQELYDFWRKGGYNAVYLRLTPNNLTGEFTCIMIKRLHASSLRTMASSDWLETFNNDFQRRLVSLLSYQFAAFPIKLALSVAAPHPNLIASQVRKAADNKAANGGDDDSSSSNSSGNDGKVMSISELQSLLTNFDLRRLESYTHNMVDYHMILDLLPLLSRLFFCQRLSGMTLSYTQCAILLGVGLQHKSVSDLEKELNVPATQLLALFNKAMRKVATALRHVEENAVRAELPLVATGRELDRPELKQSLNADLADGARTHRKGREEKQKVLATMNLEQFAIGGSDEDWNDATQGALPATISLKRQTPKGSKHSASDDTPAAAATGGSKKGGHGKRPRDGHHGGGGGASGGSRKGGDKKKSKST